MLGARRMAGPGRVSVRRAGVAVAFLLLLAFARGARAGEAATVFRDSDAPIVYQVEIEPHLVVGTAPPGLGAGSGAGVGVRASVVLAPEGFINRVNDSVAIGFGLDFGRYTGAYGVSGYRDQCTHFEPGPAGTSICTSVTSNGGPYNYLFLPVVMQWNFWLADRWSVFGEPGLNLFYIGNHGVGAAPALYVGGRFRLSDNITVTARLGYPTVGLGVSFMM